MGKIRFLLKFGERTHVEEFASGSLFCSDAITLWGIEEKLKIRGQGDILEAGSRVFTQKMTMIEHGTSKATVFSGKANALVHFEPAEHIPVFCMFTVFDHDCNISKNGELSIALSNKVKATIRSHFPNADAVAIIHNPEEYLEDVEKTIGHSVKHGEIQYFNIDKGYEANNGKDNAIDMDYMMYLVQDVPPVIENGKKTYSFVADYAYRVLFCKDVFFTDEQEYRIVLPDEKIFGSAKYPVNIRQKIDIVSIEEFMS